MERRKYTTSKAWDAKAISENESATVARALAKTRKRMGNQYKPNQLLGRREAIGCVALEITQRCNLDCTLCYLSENSENTRDVPIQKIFERIDRIVEEYGPHTSVQITGGDPTMRARKELVEIVRYAREQGLIPALFTNGIKATRSLLSELADVGLSDVAFHVDLTQERAGYKTEKELNMVRESYIERARGLPINVMFNTTVHAENFDELPDLVSFFVKHADAIAMVSFQMQADTGRGELRKREDMITVENVRNRINKGAGADLAWDIILAGHEDCNRYVPTYVVDGKVYNVIDDQQLYNDFLEDFKHVTIDRRDNLFKVAKPFVEMAVKQPGWLVRGAKYAVGKAWNARQQLVKTRGKFNKLSFFIHNFMDADNLVCERVDTCSFMVMTEDGPMSMCAHNARRDEFITRPMEVKTDKGVEIFDPLVNKKEAPSRQISNAYLGKDHPVYANENIDDHSCAGECK